MLQATMVYRRGWRYWHDVCFVVSLLSFAVHPNVPFLVASTITPLVFVKPSRSLDQFYVDIRTYYIPNARNVVHATIIIPSNRGSWCALLSCWFLFLVNLACEKKKKNTHFSRIIVNDIASSRSFLFSLLSPIFHILCCTYIHTYCTYVPPWSRRSAFHLMRQNENVPYHSATIPKCVGVQRMWDNFTFGAQQDENWWQRSSKARHAYISCVCMDVLLYYHVER